MVACAAAGFVALVAGQAHAGLMHARAVIGLGVSGQFAGHNNTAYAQRTQGSKFRAAQQQKGYSNTWGNAGSGHAHHHGNNFADPVPEGANNGPDDLLPPVMGSDSTSQFIAQTWVPDVTTNLINVTLLGETFFQIDPREYAGEQIRNFGSIEIGEVPIGFFGMSMTMSPQGTPDFSVIRTGVFENAPFEMMTHPNGVHSLRFTSTHSWNFAGDYENFDVGLNGEISGVVIPAPSATCVLLGATAWGCRRRRVK
jgi:hypothetical protein